MYIHRTIDNELLKWKSSEKRKPLLIRGARQVGKTWTIRKFGIQFEHYVEVNFDLDKNVCEIFNKNHSPHEICELLSLYYKIPIEEGKSLLFLDEIQSCIAALGTLRYFYEKMPGLHVIAAGSLLEFALEELPSVGVGRIRSIFMYPLSFNEYLNAIGETNLLSKKKLASPQNPLPKILHVKLLKYLKKFMLLGGMPEVISTFISNRDLVECKQVLTDLIISFNDDFAKYKKRLSVSCIREVFESAVMQSGTKFSYSKIEAGFSYYQIRESVRLLIMAGLIIPVVHSSANGLPLGAEANPKKRKLLVMDTGILQLLQNLDMFEITMADDFSVINKGNIAEVFIGLELLKYKSPYEKASLFYWHREAKSSNAEVDYVVTVKDAICPVEVKAGAKGAMRSMFLFLKEKNLKRGIRVSMENFSSYDNIDVYPLYATDNITNPKTDQ